MIDLESAPIAFLKKRTDDMEHFTNLNCSGIAQPGSFLLSGQN